MLRGDGQGGLEAVSPAASGLVVPGDAKGLAVADLAGTGSPDLLVTRNNAPTLAFKNNRVPGNNSLRILLRGAKGNPSAVGARVSLELEGGASQVAEVHAGSGYMSQSSPSCFFGYPDATPPLRVRVRWPSGPSTLHEVIGRPSVLIFSVPT